MALHRINLGHSPASNSSPSGTQNPGATAELTRPPARPQRPTGRLLPQAASRRACEPEKALTGRIAAHDPATEAKQAALGAMLLRSKRAAA